MSAQTRLWIFHIFLASTSIVGGACERSAQTESASPSVIIVETKEPIELATSSAREVSQSPSSAGVYSASADDQSITSDFSSIFKGTVGNTPVEALLTSRNNRVSGEIAYDSEHSLGMIFAFTGEIDAQGNLTLNETNPDEPGEENEVFAIWEGRFVSPGRIEGTKRFVRTREPEPPMPFVLREAPKADLLLRYRNLPEF